MREIKFGKAFKYVFNRPKGMLNALWILVPIIGWLALSGYGIRIIQEFVRGKFRKLPLFKFGDNLALGIMIFIKAIPLFVLYMVADYILNGYIPFGWIVSLLIAIFVLPMLYINLFQKETVKASFDLEVVKPVFKNLGDYILVLIKSLVLQIIFMIMSLFLIGIPGLMFTKNIFMADFYRRNVK